MRWARKLCECSLDALSKDGTTQQRTSAHKESCVHHPRSALVKATDAGLPELVGATARPSMACFLNPVVQSLHFDLHARCSLIIHVLKQ